MVYTVYKGVGLGIGVVAADFDDTAHIVHSCFTYLRNSSLNGGQTDHC